MKIVRGFVLFSLVLCLITFVGLPSATAKPLVLKWTTFEPDVPGSTQLGLKEMAKRVEEVTEGRVKIKIYWGSVLGKAPDFLKMVGGPGVADGGFIVTTYNQWEVPLLAAGGLPFLYKGFKVAPRAQWQIYQEWAPMQEELKRVNVKPLWFFSPHDHWLGLEEPIKSINELKGKKMWAAGFWQELADALGVVNVPMIAPQAYEALQKGVIIGIMGMPYHTWRIFKYTESVKHLYEWPFGGIPLCGHMVNLDKWNQISPKDQKAMEKVMAGMNEWYEAKNEEESVKLKGFYAKQGVTEHKLPPDEISMIEEVGKKAVWSSWKATAKKQGIPGEEWFKRFQAKVKEIGE